MTAVEVKKWAVKMANRGLVLVNLSTSLEAKLKKKDIENQRFIMKYDFFLPI